MKMKKYAASVLVAAGLIAGVSAAPVHASTADPVNVEWTILVEDKQITFDPQPFVVENRTFVPLRSLSEGLGADVQYDPATHVATITKEEIVLTLDFHTGSVKKNGVEMEVSPKPRFINNRTMVPVRFISEAFGNEVTFEANSGTVKVLPTQKTMTQREEIRAVLAKSQEATNKQKYMTMNFDFAGKLPNGQFVLDFDGKLKADASLEPLALQVAGSVNGYVFGQKQTQDLQLYMADGVMYLLNPETKQWEKNSLAQSEWDEILEAVKMGQVSSGMEAQNEALIPYAKMSEDADSYNISVKFDKHGLKKYVEAAQAMDRAAGAPSEEELEHVLAGLENLEFTYEIDKVTYLQEASDVKFAIELEGMGDVALDVKSTNTYEPVTITVPEEAKNAKEAGSEL